MPKIVIIGAGPTGLSAAYHLEQKGFFDYKIFEKEQTPGGLCRSVTQDGFTFDFTGHLLHVSDPYFQKFIDTVVGQHNLSSRIRKSFIYSNETYTRYPFQTNLFGLPADVITDCIEGFVKRKKTKTVRTFHDWVLKAFGPGFGKHFFFPYQKKIFSYDIKKISASWTGRFIPKTSLKQIVHGAVSDVKNASIGYNAQFFYPKQGGIAFWVNALANQLINPVYTDFCVETVDLKTKSITFTNGHTEYFDHLISTMPLDSLLHSLEEPSSTNLQAAAKKLLCNKVINFNLGISHADLSDKHWIYFPEKRYPFYRAGFYHNFSKSLVPGDCSSLYGEFSYMNETPKQITLKLKHALRKTKQLLKISAADIATEAIMPIEHAYVIYDLWREKHLPDLHKTLNSYSVHSVGRYGEWKYASMQEALLDGKKIADTLIMVPAQQAQDIPGFYQEIERHKAH